MKPSLLVAPWIAAVALLVWMPAASASALACSSALASTSADKDSERALMAILELAFPGEFGFDDGGMAPPGDATLLADTLASPAFLHAAVGPLDLYVYKADALAQQPAALRVLDLAVKGLTPLGQLLSQRFASGHGLIAGQRFPIVLASSDPAKKQTGFDQLIALLDWCDGGDWTRDNGTLWTEGQRSSVVVRTWRVQLVNLAHPEATAQGDAFLKHGLGYYEIAHLVFRLLRLGSWGLVPPWFDQGLMDEFDIAAYGEAWVGGDWYATETEGWYRPGWSGFVPEGSLPPPPVTGPPADLATKVRKTGDSWQHRANSPTRHWDNLVADLDVSDPVSFRFMADHESFLPRDRAYARCLMHVLLSLQPQSGAALLAALDRVPTQQTNGMFDSDPLPEMFVRALGGLDSVEVLAGMPLRTKLVTIGHPELAQQLSALGADGVLDVADHRDAGAWLYEHPDFDGEARGKIFNLILTAEHYEQHAEWALLSDALDRAMHAALKTSKTYPKDAAPRAKVVAAFDAAWAQ